ncbi:MAG: tetratricopeptide repeat protein [Agathobacter sp.]|nr:tetratricopeptide repeat protein [Agathobacter sp.]
MDKYEYNLKLDQIKTLLAEGKYKDAADIADTINWNKIKNVNALVKAGEVYEKVGRYDESREILLNAYDRSPIGRTIIYRLAEVAIKMNDFEGAKEYYDEFIDIAPHDNQRYVLRYSIKKAQGANVLELIPILEEFKEEEYTEEWAYELAYLYHKAGMIEKCIDACDELILWFGDGPYVESALELKMLYQPLTKTQEEKYRLFREEKAGKTIIDSETMERAGEFVREPVAIPQVTLNPSRFNTTNLQEEIVKGMQQIMDATEKETVVGTMDSIKKIAEEIPYLQLPTEEELAAREAELNIETDEEIDGSLRINFQELLGEESDGQMSLVMKEKAQIEQQITGQMSIADVLEEWEKTKRAAEAALYEAEQRKLESAKVRALQEAEDIMIRLNDIIPKLASVEADESISQVETQNFMSYQQEETANIEMANIQEMTAAQERALLGQVTMRMPDLTIEAAPIYESVSEMENNFIYEEGISATAEESVYENDLPLVKVQIYDDFPVKEDPIFEEEVLPIIEEPIFEEEVLPVVEEPIFEEEVLPVVEEPIFEEEILPVIEEPIFEEEVLPVVEEPVFEEEVLPITEEPVFEEDISSVVEEIKIPEIILDEEPEDLVEEVIEQKSIQMVTLTEEQKAIFSYFMPIKGMESQLCKALSGIIANLDGVPNSSSGNLIIQGSQGCGKTVLATSIVKVLQKQCGKPNGRIGKIDADALNKKNIQQLLRKVAGGCLIIERAGAITRQTAVTLSLLLEQDSSGTFVILEDTAVGIKKAMMADDEFAKKFTEFVTVPIFTNEDLIIFAKSYANELGYFIDEMAILALHNRISNIEKIDQATTLVEVKDIIDEAIEREARGGIRKAFNILTAKRYTDDDKIVLTEKDFE